MIQNALIVFITLSVSIGLASRVDAGMQGATTDRADCGYNFFPHEQDQLTRAGWHCTKDDKAVADRMKKRGFISRQFVDAYRLTHDIPRTVPADVETVAVLQLVDINPRYYFMIDPANRPSLTTYYNKKLFRRGRILTIAGYSLALVGVGLSAAGAWMLKGADDPALQENPGTTVMLFFGAASLFTGMSMGSLGVHKLRLISHEEILDTASMEMLRKRRTKTHHFAPDDLFEYQMPAETKRIIGFAPVVGPDFVGIAGAVTF